MARRIVGIVLGVLGVGLGLLTAGGAAWLVAAGRGDAGSRFLTGAALIPSGVLLLGLGAAAIWLAVRLGRPSRPMSLPPWWLSAGLFLAAVGGGWALLRAGQWGLFFPLATLAAFVPAAVAGRLALPRSGPRPPWRRVLPAFAWGALVAPLLAFALQLVAIIGVVVAVAVGLAFSGEGTLDTLQRMLDRLQGRTLSDEQSQALLQLVVRQPLVLLSGAFVVAFAGPVVEELGKFLGVALFSRGRGGAPPDRSAVVTITLMGLASGLGFATIENIFYTAAAGPQGWTALTLARGAFTPLMHGTASALFALGWARQLRDPGGWSLLEGAVSAMGLHAAWNICAGLLIVVGLLAGEGQPGPAQAVGGLALVVVFGLLILFAVGGLAGLVRIGRTLGREALADAAPTAPPPAASAVLLGNVQPVPVPATLLDEPPARLSAD